MSQAESIEQSLKLFFDEALAEARSEADIRRAQAEAMRRLGELQTLIKTVPPAERKNVGIVANRLKQHIQSRTEQRLKEIALLARRRDLERVIDVTMPGRAAPAGHLHILTQVRRELTAIFAELGFEVATGPQVETDFHNFEALAMPPDHPARDAQDTFYVEGGLVLRTHTSSVQIRTMQKRKPPIRIIAPGVVYRRDDDATHSPMFSQLAALVVDEGVR